MQKHNQHNKDERTLFFRKIYLSLYLKGFERVTKGFTVWDVIWRLNRTETYWTPTLMAITAFLSRSSGLLNQGTGGPASLGYGPHSSIFSPTDLLNRGPEGPLCWVLVLSTASYLQLIWTSCRLGYIIIWRPPIYYERHNFALNSTPRQSRLYPDIPRPDAPVIYTGAFPILIAWPGRRSICNISTRYI